MIGLLKLRSVTKFQRNLIVVDRLERAETMAAVRQGMKEFERGEGMP